MIVTVMKDKNGKIVQWGDNANQCSIDFFCEQAKDCPECPAFKGCFKSDTAEPDAIREGFTFHELDLDEALKWKDCQKECERQYQEKVQQVLDNMIRAEKAEQERDALREKCAECMNDKRVKAITAEENVQLIGEECDALKATLAGVKAERDALRGHLGKIEGMRVQVKARKNESYKLRKTIKTLSGHNSHLRQERDALKAENERLRGIEQKATITKEIEEGPPYVAKQWKDACLRELGYAHIYMHYLDPRFLNSKCSQDQKKRVEQLCMEMAVHWHHWDAKMWEAFHDQITDEIENMC